MWLGLYLLPKRQHETRLAYATLATHDKSLARALLDGSPAPEQQGEFFTATRKLAESA